MVGGRKLFFNLEVKVTSLPSLPSVIRVQGELYLTCEIYIFKGMLNSYLESFECNETFKNKNEQNRNNVMPFIFSEFYSQLNVVAVVISANTAGYLYRASSTKQNDCIIFLCDAGSILVMNDSGSVLHIMPRDLVCYLTEGRKSLSL